jgi:hypothetical protein
VEFIDQSEVLTLLREHGIAQDETGETDEAEVRLRMADGDDIVRVHLACASSQAEPDAGAQIIEMDEGRLAGVIKEIVHRLRLSQLILVPVGKWRKVFDAVAFSLAENEDWQEFETTATVELNTRDPLLCGPGDFHTIEALFVALLADGESADQGLMLTSTASPILIEAVPDGAVRVSLGNRVLADEVAEVVAV